MSFRRSQSRAASLAEAAMNVLVGYAVALAAQQLIFPLFAIRTTLAQNAGIAAAFTVVSLLRSYLLRRIFERIGTGRGGGSKLQPGRSWRLVEES